VGNAIIAPWIVLLYLAWLLACNRLGKWMTFRFLMMEALTKALHLHISFDRAHVFQMRPVSPVQCMTPWHVVAALKFWAPLFLHCAVPRIKQPMAKVVTVDVPWSRPGSGFNFVVWGICNGTHWAGNAGKSVAEVLGVNPQAGMDAI